MQVPDGGPVFPDCGFSGHGQNFVAASLACAQVLHRAGGAVEICRILGREETIARVKAGIAKLA